MVTLLMMDTPATKEDDEYISFMRKPLLSFWYKDGVASFDQRYPKTRHEKAQKMINIKKVDSIYYFYYFIIILYMLGGKAPAALVFHI